MAEPTWTALCASKQPRLIKWCFSKTCRSRIQMETFCGVSANTISHHLHWTSGPAVSTPSALIVISYHLKRFHFNKCLLSHHLSLTEVPQWWLGLWPTDDIHRKNHRRSTGTCFPSPSSGWSTREGRRSRQNRLAIFPVSASVVSKRLLWLNKQSKAKRPSARKNQS